MSNVLRWPIDSKPADRGPGILKKILTGLSCPGCDRAWGYPVLPYTSGARIYDLCKRCYRKRNRDAVRKYRERTWKVWTKQDDSNVARIRRAVRRQIGRIR